MVSDRVGRKKNVKKKKARAGGLAAEQRVEEMLEELLGHGETEERRMWYGRKSGFASSTDVIG